MKYLALLRGINVGGKNLILKEELRQAFEELGFKNVRTYIQSGNVLFRTDKTSAQALTRIIEKDLSARFSYGARAVVLSDVQYRSEVQSAHEGWGKNDAYKHNALFTLGDITPMDVLVQLPTPKKHLEVITPGASTLFWSVSKKQLAKSRFMKLPMAPVYQEVTVRNHNTVFKLLELFEEL